VVGEKALRDVAESVTSAPSTVGPSLKMPCQRRPGPGLHDRLKTGTAPTEWVIGGTIPGTENRIPLLPHEVDGVKLLIIAYGCAVVRQLDAAHWMSADSTKTDRRPCAAWS
jgi:hypothetical protein